MTSKRQEPSNQALERLLDRGNTVVTIEHNLDIVKEADYVVDLGPGGGNAGGRIVLSGPPEQLLLDGAGSHTARFSASTCASSPRPARRSPVNWALGSLEG